jgi:hypothetical protein
MSKRKAQPDGQFQGFSSFGELIEGLAGQERYANIARQEANRLAQEGCPALAIGQCHEINRAKWRVKQRLERTPGYDRIVVVCNRRWGEDPSASNLKRLRGELCCMPGGKPIAEVNRMTVDEAANQLPSMSNASAKSEPVRRNAERNQWCYEHFVNRPNSKLSTLRAEAKTLGWTIKSDPAFKRAVQAHCTANNIPIPTRHDKRIKQN